LLENSLHHPQGVCGERDMRKHVDCCEYTHNLLRDRLHMPQDREMYR
jgi:hypothetical protein